MNKKLKSLIALTLVTMLTSQAIAMEVSNHVMASQVSSVQTISTINSNDDSLGGFQLVSNQWIEDLKSNVYVYKHIKSGARLIYIQNNSDNKMMSINFRTPAKDNTGVNHVIEHSVLNGSKNYPVKDLINEMGKQSLSTFLDAMTTNDYTMYPVSSKNDKDFQNLMGVYLDAVFYPNVLKDKRIFQQEGIRYELNSPNDELKYNGVVYNEMKGDYSSPDWILHKSIEQSLFPDTSYRFESGGLPDDIPNLTYDELVKTYNENYNPSNSYIYLYGKMDIQKELKFIGDKYLNNFDKKEANTELQLQKPFTKRAEKTVEYSIQKDEPIDNKTYLSLNYVIGKSTDKDLVEEFAFIKTLLGGIPSSPIIKALRDNGFGENVQVQFSNNNIQPTLSIIAANVNENQKDKFVSVVQQTLQDIVQKGFDSKLLDSVSKVYQLSNSMIKGNYALGYNQAIMSSWLYGGDPTTYLSVNSDMANIKNKMQSGYLQSLIKKYLLDNTFSSLVILKPVPGLEAQKEAELKNKLAKYKASLSKEQIDELVKQTQEFKKWQETPPTQQEINTLPSLSLNDISSYNKTYTTIEKNENGIKVLDHPIDTNGVDYISLYFDTTKVPQDKLGYMYLLSQVLGNVDTKNYSMGNLAEQVLINSGGISFSPMSFVQNGNSDMYFPKMDVSLVALNDNVPQSFNLLKEIIFNSNLNDKARLKQIISSLKMQEEQIMQYDGSNLAADKVLSYMSLSGKYQDYQEQGLYQFLSDLDTNFDSKSDEIIKNLQQVRDLIFNKNNLVTSFIGDQNSYQTFNDSFANLATTLKTEKLPSYTYNFDNSKNNEGIVVPSNVQYVDKGGSLKSLDSKEDGKLMVLQNILESDYLWKNIRIKGGAYGTNMDMINGDEVLLSSYRDPNLKKTIDTFNGIPNYLKNFNADKNQMTNYIIGAVGKFDNSFDSLEQLLGPAANGIIADQLYFTGEKPEDIQKERQDMLNTTAEDIRNFAPIMESILNQNHISVVGGEAEIEKNKSLFNSVESISSK
jgi:Zn-dependent M16 (insulinase) family peptidase